MVPQNILERCATILAPLCAFYSICNEIASTYGINWLQITVDHAGGNDKNLWSKKTITRQVVTRECHFEYTRTDVEKRLSGRRRNYTVRLCRHWRDFIQKVLPVFRSKKRNLQRETAPQEHGLSSGDTYSCERQIFRISTTFNKITKVSFLKTLTTQILLWKN